MQKYFLLEVSFSCDPGAREAGAFPDVWESVYFRINSVSSPDESRSCGKSDRFRRVQACPTELVPSREPLLSGRSFLTELSFKDEKTRWPQKTSLARDDYF